MVPRPAELEAEICPEAETWPEAYILGPTCPPMQAHVLNGGPPPLLGNHRVRPEFARIICRQQSRWAGALEFSRSWPPCQGLGTCAHRACAFEVARKDEIFIPFGDLVANKDMAGQGKGGTASCTLGALCICLAHKWPLQFSSPAACAFRF